MSKTLESLPDTPEALAERLRLALDFAEMGEWNWDPATDQVKLAPMACRIFGLPADTRITWADMQRDLLHPQDAPAAAAAVNQAIEEHSTYTIEYRIRRANDGREAWVKAVGKARYDEAGRPASMIGLVEDITDRKNASLLLNEDAQIFEILNRTGSLIASELTLEKMVQAVTDAGVELSGAQFGAFFYNVTDHKGEQYMLYTLSGAPREAFSRFPMPRNTHVFAPTFSGTATVRSDDITKDPRYGRSEPYRGMPPGHLPVRSYLAVPVVSRSGEVIGGLFFGHEKVGVFDARDERILEGIAAQAAIGIDNARLLQRAQSEIREREKVEQSLRALADGLEVRIRDRTRQLEEINARLQEEIAERKRTEEALWHAQKLEAVGQLTGGVAHDFNNLLTIVIGNLDGLKRRFTGQTDARTRHAVENALEGARKATQLTQRLLAFARRQPLNPKAADTNKLIQSMSELLGRTLGESIEIEVVLGAGVWPIDVDVVQLESAIINLALNARDAMPSGGKLTIETTNVRVDDKYGQAHLIPPGQYVAICISDSGTGIPSEIIDQVFEPFFTTKPTGQGTGLGLSQVYGFVKQSGGNVRIYSEVGDGTTVKLYLPRLKGELGGTEPDPQAILPADLGETILVVEDEPGVRALTVSYLQELGYRTLQAADGPTALNVLQNNRNVDLLFTDVGLPKMNGRQLAEEAVKIIPTLRVLYTTGYARNAIVHHGRLDPGLELIVKPFTFDDLADKIRTILDRR